MNTIERRIRMPPKIFESTFIVPRSNGVDECTKRESSLNTFNENFAKDLTATTTPIPVVRKTRSVILTKCTTLGTVKRNFSL
jgi:hypothetical protein